jgi:hypothetical protein
MIFANLIEKRRLFRKINVVTPEGVFEVIYNGQGLGYEEIVVNNEIANRTNSYFWYVPEFEFRLGNLPAKVNVSVSVQMKIKQFSLTVSGEEIYTD